MFRPPVQQVLSPYQVEVIQAVLMVVASLVEEAEGREAPSRNFPVTQFLIEFLSMFFIILKHKSKFRRKDVLH